jgi:hypothetical protein
VQSRIEPSYNTISGTISESIVIGSWPGRSIATTAITRIAYRRPLRSWRVETMPTRVTARIPIGTWKHSPIAIRTVIENE